MGRKRKIPKKLVVPTTPMVEEPLKIYHTTLLWDAANATLRSETLREIVCDAIIVNGVV